MCAGYMRVVRSMPGYWYYAFTWVAGSTVASFCLYHGMRQILLGIDSVAMLPLRIYAQSTRTHVHYSSAVGGAVPEKRDAPARPATGGNTGVVKVTCLLYLTQRQP